MTIEQLKEKVMSASRDDCDELLILLEEKIADIHIAKLDDNADDETIIRNNMETAICYRLIEVCKGKIVDFQQQNVVQLSKFREASEICLPDEQYQMLLAGSRLFSTEWKQFKKSLKQNSFTVKP